MTFLEHIGILKMIILCCSVQVENIIQHTNAKLHGFTQMINLLTILQLGIGLKILLNILLPSFMWFHQQSTY